MSDPSHGKWSIGSAFQHLHQFVQPSLYSVRFDVLERLIVDLSPHRRCLAGYNDCGKLFLNQRGGPLSAGQLTELVGKLTSRFANCRISPATIRISFAFQWLTEHPNDYLTLTHLRGAHIVLRSKTPDLVRQEFYGLMMAHFAICGLMHEAALKVNEDPDRLSFLHAIRVVRRKLAAYGAISPSAQGGFS